MTIKPTDADYEAAKLALRPDTWSAIANGLPEAFSLHAQQARKQALEDAAKACEEQRAVFASEQYATDQPMSSFGERFACSRCAEVVRALDQTTEPQISATFPQDGR
jgi:hypothetical protein